MGKLNLGSDESQYGDKTVLDKFRTATKPMPISGAPAPKRGAGRPAAQPASAPPQSSPEAGGQLPPEHLTVMQKLAKAEEVANYWQNLAQTVPTSFTQMYAKRATEVRDRLALKLYRDTPNFDI